jgi:hypothetical protein
LYVKLVKTQKDGPKTPQNYEKLKIWKILFIFTGDFFIMSHVEEWRSPTIVKMDLKCRTYGPVNFWELLTKTALCSSGHFVKEIFEYPSFYDFYFF